MTARPLVSVIIPTYNRASWVGQAVESVLGQTFASRELLVVDDGSADETWAVLSPHARALRYIRTPHLGVSAARNRGVRESRGQWVAFLDSDDLWMPGKLTRQMDALRRAPEAPLCYTDEIWIRHGRRVNPGRRHRKYSGWIFEHCVRLCIISPSSALVRRDLLDAVGGFDEGLPACEDYDLWLRITARHPVLFLDEPLIVKRGGHADQLSRSIWGLDRFRVRALWKLLEDPAISQAQRDAVRRELGRKCSVLMQGARKRGHERAAVLYERLAATGRLEDVHDWQEILAAP